MTFTLSVIFIPVILTIIILLIGVFYPRSNDSYGIAALMDISIAIILSLSTWIIYLAIT